MLVSKSSKKLALSESGNDIGFGGFAPDERGSTFSGALSAPTHIANLLYIVSAALDGRPVSDEKASVYAAL
jgi:hypothetical protein